MVSRDARGLRQNRVRYGTRRVFCKYFDSNHVVKRTLQCVYLVDTLGSELRLPLLRKVCTIMKVYLFTIHHLPFVFLSIVFSSFVFLTFHLHTQ